MNRLTKAVYLGKVKLVDPNGQEVNVQVVRKDIPKNYWKVNVEDLIKNLGNMTPKSMIVIDYVLRHTDYDSNKFIGTNKDISNHFKDNPQCHVGYSKIAKTLGFLASHHIIDRHRRGIIMWNPDIINHQIKTNVPDLLIQYRVNDGKYKVVKHSSEANIKRTAKARKTRSKKRQLKNKARKAKEARDKRRGWTTSRTEAKKLGIGYQTNFKFGKNGKNKKASSN